MKTLERLTEFRRSRNMSRAKVARLLGLSDRTIFAWEMEGKPIPELTALGIEAWLAKQEGREISEIEPLVDGIGKN